MTTDRGAELTPEQLQQLFRRLANRAKRLQTLATHAIAGTHGPLDVLIQNEVDLINQAAIALYGRLHFGFCSEALRDRIFSRTPVENQEEMEDEEDDEGDN